MMSESRLIATHSPREPLFDLLRGIAVILMIVSHAIFFFHTDTNEVLRVIARMGNATVFTILLFVSGAVSYKAYFASKSWNYAIGHILSRSVVIYAVYALVAVVAVLTDIRNVTIADQLHHIFLALIFYDVPSFSEFLIPFLIYPMTLLLFPNVYSWIQGSASRWFILASVVYLLGVVLFLVPVPWFFVPLKAMLVGEEGYLRYPFFQYFPVFTLGFYWVSSINFDDTKIRLTSIYRQVFLSGAVVIISGIFGMVYSLQLADPLTRWPPSVGFIALGIFSLYVCALIILLLPQHRLLSQLWRILGYIGMDSFDLFIVHIILLFTYNRFISMRFENPFVVATMTMFLLVVSVIISSLNWKASPSVFTVGPITLTNAGRYRIKKRYLAWTTFLLLVIFVQLSSPHLSPIGSFLKKTDLIPQPNVSVELNKRWFIREPDKTLEPLTITVIENEKLESISYQYSIPQLSLSGDILATTAGIFSQTIPLNDVDEGQYSVSVIHNQGVPGFPLFETTIYITQPMYASWTLDWEGWDVSDAALSEITAISRRYNNMPITHFFSPRIYLSEVVPEDRAMYLTGWLMNRIQQNRDEIALHLHMQYDMIRQTGVEPKTEPKWNYRSEEGYDVYTSAYSKEELDRIYLWALNEFALHGLPRPFGYRAGGWYADSSVLRAAEEAGFLYDASGREQPLTGSFRNIPWRLNARTLPYYPSIHDQNSGGAENLGILEIPNNGLDTFSYQTDTLLQRYYANYKDGILHEPRVITYVSHPQWYTEEFPKIRKVLETISQQSGYRDSGPVIFTTQQSIYELWKDSFTP